MDTRDALVQKVADYLEEHFPGAQITSALDGLTRNEVFTVTEDGTTRHVEVTDRWFDQDADVIPLQDAIRSWGLAEEIRRLDPNGILRIATSGLERVS
jgi:hypothetical protein